MVGFSVEEVVVVLTIDLIKLKADLCFQSRFCGMNNQFYFF